VLLQLDELEHMLVDAGEALATDIRQRVLDICEALEADGHADALQDLHLTPIYAGELQMEWHDENAYIEMEVRLNGRYRIYGDVVGIKEKSETTSARTAAEIVGKLLDIADLYVT
jgi:hypothetical protein